MSEGDDLGEALRQALSESLRKEKAARETAEAELGAAKKTIEALEAQAKKAPASAPPPRSASPPPPLAGPTAEEIAAAAARDAELRKNLEETLQGIKELRELLARTRRELSDLQADEVALSKKRAKVLTDACELLATACGETGQPPPPIPLQILPGGPLRRPSMSIDISEVAELLESLRPPPPPKVE